MTIESTKLNAPIQITDRQKKLNAMCWRVFEDNEDGRKLLELLVEEYIVERPVIVPNYLKVLGDHAVGFREGQNDMLREIKNRITSHINFVNTKTNKEK